MALIDIINVSSPNDGLGDTLRDSQVKANDNFAELNAQKVEVVAGKGLSENDFTDAEQTKLSGVEAGAQANVQADWLQSDNLADDYIKNKPNDGNLQVSGIYSFLDPDFVIYAGWVWQINGVYYTNPIDITIPVTYCAAGLVRKDIVFFNEANTASTVTGLEVASDPVIPTLPANTVLLAVIDVTDGAISGIPQSVTDELADHNKLYWDASTNTPSLADVTGRIGNYYTVSVAGTVNFGSGNITFGIGDEVKHNSIQWYKAVDNNQGGGTNLTNTPSPTEISINSSTGSGTSLPLADVTNAGLFSPAEKVIVNNLTDLATSGLSVRNSSDVQEFLSIEKILFEGVTFDAGQQKVIIDPKTPFVVFIDTVSGNDGTGQIENKNKPFLTDTAAISALPVDDGTLWLLEYIDSGVTRTFASHFPARKLKVKTNGTGEFDFSSVTGANILATYLELDIPFCDFRHQSVTLSNFGSGTGDFILNCKNIIQSTPALDSIGFFRNGTNTGASCIIAQEYDAVNSGVFYNVGISGKYIVGNTKLYGGGTAFITTSGDIEVDTSINSTGAAYNDFILNANNAMVKIRALTGTNELDIFRTFVPNATVDIDGIDLGTSANLVIVANANGNASGGNKVIRVKGTSSSLTDQIRFLRRAGGVQGGNKIILDNFTSYINTLDIADQWAIDFINSNIIVDNALIDLPSFGIVGVDMIGFQTIRQITPTDLVTGATVATNINHNGFNHNSTGDGVNVTFTNLTPNTK